MTGAVAGERWIVSCEKPTWTDAVAETMTFTGHERDSSTTAVGPNRDYWYYMHARYDSPNLGRFLSVDTHSGAPAEPQSWNRYSYARDNPVRMLDLDGRVAFEFKIRHFIPATSVQLPHGRNVGDARTFSLLSDASVRTERTIRVETDPALSRSGLVSIEDPRIGGSHNLTFDLGGRASGSSMTADVSRIPGWGVLITATQNEGEPPPASFGLPQAALFVTGKGGIRSTVNILVSEDGTKIDVFGQRSSFPAMEINATVDNQTFAIYRGNESHIPFGFGIFGTEKIDRECEDKSGNWTCH